MRASTAQRPLQPGGSVLLRAEADIPPQRPHHGALGSIADYGRPPAPPRRGHGLRTTTSPWQRPGPQVAERRLSARLAIFFVFCAIYRGGWPRDPPLKINL